MIFTNETLKGSVKEWLKDEISCEHKYGHISNWNVSQVTNMSYMFCGATNFNQPLNNWDVSKVTNMSRMFYGATNFNQPLNNWDVSKVTDMSYMFFNATNFNQPLNNWNVSKVTGMYGMFGGATNFNQPLNNWDVSKVTDMESMFKNSKLEQIYNITDLNIPTTHLYFNFTRRCNFVLASNQLSAQAEETQYYSKQHKICNKTIEIPEMLREICLFM